MRTIFIDGEAGTTGLMIKSLIAPLVDSGAVEVISIKDRKDPAQRAAALNEANISILCLHDDIAREAVSMVTNGNARIIDASSAHRVSDGWTYGFPELSRSHAETIRTSKRVTNPGCFATGAIAILKPLVDAKMLAADASPHLFGVSGYSGGGKELIAKYEDGQTPYAAENALRNYALHAPHKHLPEIRKYAGLGKDPLFMPFTINAARGMSVVTSLHGDIDAAHAALAAAYDMPESKVHVMPLAQSRALQSVNWADFAALNTGAQDVEDKVVLYVTGFGPQVNVTATLDNLGKGAASQAIQNLRLMLSA